MTFCPTILRRVISSEFHPISFLLLSLPSGSFVLPRKRSTFRTVLLGKTSPLHFSQQETFSLPFAFDTARLWAFSDFLGTAESADGVVFSPWFTHLFFLFPSLSDFTLGPKVKSIWSYFLALDFVNGYLISGYTPLALFPGDVACCLTTSLF